MRENWLVAVLLLLALPVLAWPVRHSLNGQVLQTWLIVGAFALAGAGLVVGAVVAWGRLAAWFRAR